MGKDSSVEGNVHANSHTKIQCYCSVYFNIVVVLVVVEEKHDGSAPALQEKKIFYCLCRGAALRRQSNVFTILGS